MAGRIPQSFINDLLARIDIVDVIDARLTLRKTGRNHTALCPFHNEKTPSFSVNPEKQFYYCFGCGATGTALTFLMEFEHLDFVSAVESLAATAGLEVPRERGRGPARDDRGLYELHERAARYFQRMLRSHADAARAQDYLRGRGLRGVLVQDFGIGFAPPGWDGLRQALGDVPVKTLAEAGLLTENDNGRVYDRFRDRIMFPIRDSRGRVIAFGGRVLSAEDQPKYLNSPETPIFHKSRELYGLFEARRAVRRLERLLLVEGYMDVVALAQAGIPNAVAALGTASSAGHFERLFRTVPEVICCFDGDNAGREAAWKALRAALPSLQQGRQLKFVFLPDGDDPDTLVRRQGQAGFETQLAGAVSAVDFLFRRLGRGLDLNALDDRARYCELALPLIGEVPPGPLRELMLGRLAADTELPLASLQQRLGAGAHAAAEQPPRVARSPAAGPSPGRPPDKPRAGRPGHSERLRDQLLAIVIQHPDFVQRLDAERRDRLLEEGDALLAGVLAFFVEHPGDDATALLGYWSGDAAHETLVRLADRHLLLDGPALETELEEAVDRYLALGSKASRQSLLRDLHENASLETLERWQRQIQPAVSAD